MHNNSIIVIVTSYLVPMSFMLLLEIPAPSSATSRRNIPKSRETEMEVAFASIAFSTCSSKTQTTAKKYDIDY